VPGSQIAIALGDVDAVEEQIVDQSKRIDFYITEYSVELLANKMRSGDFLVPPYQRAFTWEPDRKSKFLESLIMGLPIPFLFFWEMPDGRLEVVDGSQRLRTITEFLFDEFRLGALEQLSLLENYCFDDLPESRQRKIKNRSIRGIVLNEHADEAARLDMFERINTGSKIANKAEVRRGALAGPFLELVIELARNADLKKLAPISESLENERGYEELVTRFFAYGDGLQGYKDRPSDFIFNYSKAMNARFAEDPSLASSYRDRFVEMLAFVQRIFPYGFRRSRTGKATPRARFESIAIGSYTALKERPALATASREDLHVSTWLSSDDFVEVTGADGANARARLEGRIGFVRERLLHP
jgi:hypothetical protein